MSACLLCLVIILYLALVEEVEVSSGIFIGFCWRMGLRYLFDSEFKSWRETDTSVHFWHVGPFHLTYQKKAETR